MDGKKFLKCMNSDFPQLQATKEDIENPTPAFLEKYYSLMILQVTRFTPKELCSLNNDQIACLKQSQSGQYLVSHIRRSNLYKMVKYIFKKIDIFKSEFHLSDMLLPNLAPNRALVFMTTMYFFYISCAEFDALYQKEQTVDVRNDRKTKLVEENFNLKMELMKCEENKKNCIERMQLIRKKLEEYALKNEEVQNMLKDKETQESLELQKLRQCEEQEKKMQEEYNKTEEEKKYSETLIVSEDTNIVEEFQRVQEKRELCLSRMQKLEKQKQGNVETISMYEKILGLQEKLVQILKEEPTKVENKDEKHRNFYQKLQQLKKECEGMEIEEAELKASIKEKADLIPGLREQLAMIQAEKDSTCCIWAEKLQKYHELKRELEQNMFDSMNSKKVDSEMEESTRCKEIEQLKHLIEVKTVDLVRRHEKANCEITKLQQEVIKYLFMLKEKAESSMKK